MLRNVLILVSMVICTFTYAQPNEFSFKKEYTVSTPAKLTLTVVDSDIKALGSDGDKIEVYYMVRKEDQLQTITFEELEEYFTIDIQEYSDGIKMEVKPTIKNSSMFGNSQYRVSFYILTPKTITCTLNSVDGDISVKTLKGEQDFSTVDGDIKFSEIIGNVTAKTTDGDIKLSKVKGNIELHTTDGDIEINGVIGNIMAKTTDGDVSIKLTKGEINIVAIDGDISAEIAELSSPVTISTTDGDIHTLLPDNSSFNILVKGDDIKNNFKNFVGKVDDDFMEGSVNGGGQLVKLTTGDGDINIDFKN